MAHFFQFIVEKFFLQQCLAILTNIPSPHVHVVGLRLLLNNIYLFFTFITPFYYRNFWYNRSANVAPSNFNNNFGQKKKSGAVSPSRIELGRHNRLLNLGNSIHLV